ncbi:hypothetical protein IQ277_29755 [Nostocales cyanobacterium LEGE 12452]|nr:hypothetical protein [Nostocales cyanobacterium LEGE 12452]
MAVSHIFSQYTRICDIELPVISANCDRFMSLVMIALAMPAAGYAYANPCFYLPETFAATELAIVSYFCRSWSNVRS